MKIEFRWEQKKGKYVSGLDLFVAKWLVGSVCWDPSNVRDDAGDSLPWAARTILPGLKAHLGNFKHDKDAQRRVEKSVQYWFDTAVPNAGVPDVPAPAPSH